MRTSGIIKQSQSWEQFRSAVAALPTTKAKGDAFEGLCAAFLRTDPRYVAELKSLWLRHEVPATIAKRLNLPPSDEGIDGIAQTHDGEFWSFQCKFLANHRSTLTKNDLDGFSHLSFTHCKGITKALVLHTSSAPIRKHKILGISEVGLREFEGLDEDGWAAIRAAVGKSGHSVVTHKPRQPRPHQDAAVAAITAHLKAHDRGRVLMACGSGKSLVGFWVQAAIGAKQVVVAVPSLSLLNQTLKEWATEWSARGETVRYTAVCGDESAADLGDSFVGHAYELGIDTYTDEAKIAERLKSLRGEHHVVFATYQSSHRLAAAAKAARHTFDLGILDEAHKTVVERGDRYATLLNPKVAIRKRIAMTATERVLKGTDDRVLSMDDPQVYGEVAFSYTFKAAIADGVICDYKVITLAVSESRMRELIASNKHLKLHGRGKEDRLRLAQDLAAGELLAKAQSEHGVRHAISFHRSIAAASGFADQWETVDRMVKRRVRSTAFHVSSKVPTGQRMELLRQFRESPSAVITNARCLTEGVDVPNVDAVLFADPRRSTVDIVQAVGRALRKSRDKPDKIGYVLLPVLVEDGQTVDEFLESSAFKEVGRVLAVLSTHDERIAEEFRAVEGGGTRNSRESRIVFGGDVPVGVKLSAEEFAARCGARVWQRLAKINWRPFEEAREFVRGLRLGNLREWKSYIAGELENRGGKPVDIPASPQAVYRGRGWINLGDWLGTGSLSNRDLQFRGFAEARHFARSLGVNSGKEWRLFAGGKRPDLGMLPSDIPRAPWIVYRRRGWQSMGDWLNTDVVAVSKRRFRDFAGARDYARSLGLSSIKEWERFCVGAGTRTARLPSDIPTNPQRTYREQGWVDWSDWLGSKIVATYDRKYWGYLVAREFVRSLRLRNVRDWRRYVVGQIDGVLAKPSALPSAPELVYKEEWQGYPDFLGTARTRRSPLGGLRPFVEAREFARSLGLRGVVDWTAYSRGEITGLTPLPMDIPKDPRQSYRGQGWIGWGDWLGTGTVATHMRAYRPFTEARAWARGLGLRGGSEWSSHCAGPLAGKPSKPADIPTYPNKAYKHKGWIGWRDWLGTAWRPFTEARAWARALRLETSSDWRQLCADRLEGKPSKPLDIPSAPDQVYVEEGWIGWRDWLGTGAVRRSLRVYRPFAEARAWARGLGLRRQQEWYDVCGGRLNGKPAKPPDIPSNPNLVYKDKGWIGYADWLGTSRKSRKPRKKPS
jgi:superfamily II DNA or RNA helicase